MNLELSFVTDKELRNVNIEYLKHRYSTDIITFVYEKRGHRVEGECLISLDSVRKNAKLYETGYDNELKRVIVHGCLHLVGYADKTVKEKEQMRAKENFYLG